MQGIQFNSEGDKMTQQTKNREKFKELKEKHPHATFAYFRRGDDTLVDVPISQVEHTIIQRPTWFLDSLITPGHFTEQALTAEPEIVIPPKPSEILEQPPADNEHVAEGATKFNEPQTSITTGKPIPQTIVAPKKKATGRKK